MNSLEQCFYDEILGTLMNHPTQKFDFPMIETYGLGQNTLQEAYELMQQTGKRLVCFAN